MNEYVEILRCHVQENPTNYGTDVQSILEILFTYYQHHEFVNESNAMRIGDVSNYISLLE